MAYIAQQHYRLDGRNYLSGSVIPDEVVKKHKLTKVVQMADAIKAAAGESGSGESDEEKPKKTTTRASK